MLWEWSHWLLRKQTKKNNKSKASKPMQSSVMSTFTHTHTKKIPRWHFKAWEHYSLPPLPSSFGETILLPVVNATKVNSWKTLKYLAAIGWVPVIQWLWSSFRHQAKVIWSEDRASRYTSEVPACDAGCPRLPDCRADGRRTTPW